MRFLTTIFFGIFLGTLFAQEKNDVIRQRVEFISEQLESEDLDLTNLFDQLYYYFDHPINLNNTTVEKLRDLGLLSDLQINDLFVHLRSFGKLISIYELQSLAYWDMTTIEMVLPFVRVDDRLDNLSVTIKEALKQGKIEAFLRYQSTIEEKKAYTKLADSISAKNNSYYSGNADRYYTRFRYSYRTNLSVGLTAEKDPGESFGGKNNPNGFDFYSAHAYYSGGKYLKTVALGDYQVQIGQGLNFWSGYAFGKTSDANNIKKSATSLRPYTSVDENRFMRGAAVDLGWKKFSLLNFVSYKSVDAAVVADSLIEEQEFVSSINVTGFHRTNSELARRNAFNEKIAGSNLRYSNRRLSFGLATVYQGYDKMYSKALAPYNQFDFRGKQTVTSSIDYNYLWKNFNFFGELSQSSHSKAFAQLHGVLIALDPNISLSVLYRNYERAYSSFYNAGFAEASSTQNEKGVYFGSKIRLNRSLILQAYADYFKFPWLKYLVDGPSVGYEYLIQPTYRPNKTFEIYFRYREQVRQKNSRDSDGTVSTIEEVLQRNYRLNLSYNVSEGIVLKSRIEWVSINRKSNQPEAGLLLYQDLIIRPKSWPLDLSFRYALFDTDSYDSRIYAFESNALYVFSVPGYYYQGSRAYCLMRYTFLKRFDLWARYAVNVYANRSSIGTGAEEITGNRKSDITLQLRVKF